MKARYIFAKYFWATALAGPIRRFQKCNGNFTKTLVYHNVPFKGFEQFESHIKYIAGNYGFIDPDTFQKETGEIIGAFRGTLIASGSNGCAGCWFVVDADCRVCFGSPCAVRRVEKV